MGGADSARSGDCRGLESDKKLESPSALTTTLSYLQAMDEPGMSLLDQSVIKKGKEEWRASARAELGEMMQALAHRPSVFPTARPSCVSPSSVATGHSFRPSRGAAEAASAGSWGWLVTWPQSLPARVPRKPDHTHLATLAARPVQGPALSLPRRRALF